MKIERISENQIRCTLSRADLAERQIELGELAYGSEKARRLFHEMIEAAADEVGFDVDNVPLMVEAIPLSMDSIMLIVTRVEDPDELDTRFSRFSPYTEDEWEENSIPSELARGLLEGAGLVNEELPASAPNTEVSAAQPDVLEYRLFAFSSLDLAAEAASAVRGAVQVHSSLYKHPDDGQYYLCVFSSGNADAFRRICNNLSEYGIPKKDRGGTLAYCQEHGETIIASRALDKLTKLA